MALPIWRDYFVNLGSDDSLDYRVSVKSGQTFSTIYNGRAYKKPGESTINIRINDICADYITNVLPTLPQAAFEVLDLPVTFMVEGWDDNQGWYEIDTQSFTNDWSYDSSFNPATMGLAAPINGRVDARQWVLFTTYVSDSITATLTFADGSTVDVIVPIALTADFNSDFNSDFARALRPASSGTFALDLSEWPNVVSVDIDGTRYEVVTDCREWVLYYENAYGGWDSLLIEGNSLTRDDLTRYTYETEYDNRVVSNRSKRNFVNEITKNFTLYTSVMSDDESSRMHHLLNSTEVYLYNIGSGDMLPVILSNTETEYKTFKNQGGKMVSYTIEATLAQYRIRR